MRSERGVSLILAAFALVLGLWGLLTFAWLPLVHRNAKLELQVLADAACGGVSTEDSLGVVNQIPFQRQMWEAFQGKFDNPDLKYVEVTEAKLFLATPPGDFSGSGVWPFSPAPGDPSGVQSFVNQTSNSVCFRGANNTFLQTDFEVPNCGAGIALEDVLPINAANNIRNFGHTSVCALTGEVRAELFGISLAFLGGGGEDRTIQVSSGFWAPVRGANSSPPLPLPNGNPLDVSNSPGMFLAIAPQIPQLDDGVVADRFRFPATHQFRSGNFDIQGSPDCGNLVGDTSQGPRRAFACKNSSQLVGTGGSLPETPAVPPAGLIQRRYACINPLVMARNIFTGSLVSLASRHGQLRQMTEVGLVNSRVFDGVNPITSELAPPALMRTSSDGDPFDVETKLPYLYLRFPNLPPPQNIFTPLNTTRDIERIVTSQLAQCEHLYAGLDAASHPFSELFNGFTNDNLDFQGPQYDNLFDGAPDSQNALDPKWHWESNVDLDSTNFSFTAPLNSNDTDKRIFQTLMMLGAVKLCPYYGIDSPCDNPATNTFRAFPDLEGVLNYLSEPNGLAFSVDRVGISERQAPGIGVDGIEIRNQPYNFPLGVIVMHDIPPGIDVTLPGPIQDFNNLDDLVDWSNARPLNIVLFPSRPVDVTALRTALGIGINGDRRFLNSLTVIEPCELRADVSGSNNGARRYPDFCDDSGNLLIGSWGGEENLWRSFWLALAGEPIIGGNALPESDTAYGRALEFFRMKVTRASSFF